MRFLITQALFDHVASLLSALSLQPLCDSLSDMISSVALIVRENINLRRGFWYALFVPCQREDDRPR